MQTKSRLLVVSGVAAALLLVGAFGADAAVDGAIDELPVAKANPGLSEDLIKSLPPAVQQSDVIVDPNFKPGTPIYYPDGRLVEGQNPNVVNSAMAAACSLTVTALPGGAWGTPSECSVGIFGHAGYYRAYSWAATSDTQGCIQVRGTYFETTPEMHWYAAGCGYFNSVSVYWGNVLMSPATRALSQSLATGWIADWQS